MKLTSKQRLCAFFVNLLIPLSGMSTDIYLPSLPAMSMKFHVTKAMVQLTVTSFTLAMAISQLFAGPISDALGRKKLIMGSTLLQLLSIIGILFSPSMNSMIALRFIQGFSVGFMIVPARAILSDVFEGDALKKQFNYATIAFALGPIIAPFIGGHLQAYFGWQANFIFILIYIIVILLFTLFLYRETLKNSRQFSLHHLWKNYYQISKNHYFLFCSLFVGIAYGYSVLFSVSGPFLVQVTLHQSAISYGFIALLMGLAWFLGNTINRVLFNYSKKLKVNCALSGIFLSAVALLLFAKFGFLNLLALVIPTFISVMLSGLIFPVYISECLITFKELAASANAFLFSVVWVMFSGFTLVSSQLKSQTLYPYGIAFMGTCLLSMLVYYGFIARTKH
ncbi:MAG: MFS transporter [Gammaproteobacteria bacterium CG11_big_fil_rev_8_21_14_0_20_46_22]|nr:MAG: MFS transporter [Gammaproteobacteria bacterium CG12_big_fil_rev_8_21_14_0_65_46_12]PIR10597.1 MAG: MFS transporter [Gammaproteobacteria bacterium CG11_big_fil_rev_8_21_14_0_20_46_22]